MDDTEPDDVLELDDADDDDGLGMEEGESAVNCNSSAICEADVVVAGLASICRRRYFPEVPVRK